MIQSMKDGCVFTVQCNSGALISSIKKSGSRSRWRNNDVNGHIGSDPNETNIMQDMYSVIELAWIRNCVYALLL